MQEFYKSESETDDDDHGDEENTKSIAESSEIVRNEIKESAVQANFNENEKVRAAVEKSEDNANKIGEEKMDLDNEVNNDCEESEQRLLEVAEKNDTFETATQNDNFVSESIAMEEINISNNSVELNEVANNDVEKKISDSHDNINEDKRISEEYEFNLDDLEEENNSENQQQQLLNSLIEKYTDQTTNHEKPKSRLALLREKFAQIKPKLSGNPNDVIDLDDGVVRKNEITHLIERFMKHVQPQHVAKSNELQIR